MTLVFKSRANPRLKIRVIRVQKQPFKLTKKGMILDSKTMAKKTKPAKTHADLTGFKIEVNEFGEIIRSRDVAVLNAFLNENLDDLKLNEHPDFQKKDNPKL